MSLYADPTRIFYCAGCGKTRRLPRTVREYECLPCATRRLAGRKVTP